MRNPRATRAFRSSTEGIRKYSLRLALVLLIFPSVVPAARAYAFNFPTDKYVAAGSQLEPVRFLPEGVTIKSGEKDLRVDYAGGASSPTAERIAFYVVLPPGASLTPEIIDYELKVTAEESTQTRTAVLTKADERNTPALAKALSPSRLVAAEDEGIIRFYRIVKVTLSLGSVSVPGVGTCTIQRASLRFPFTGELQKPEALPESTQSDQGFGLVLHHLLANPEALALYGDRAQGKPNTATELPAPWSPAREDSGKWFKLLIGKDGLYRITAKHLRAAGISPEAVRPDAIRLFSRGKLVPSLVLGSPATPFTSDQNVVFYGRASGSKYSVERAYWVNVTAAPGKSASPMTIVRTPASLPNPISTTVRTMQDLLVEEDKDLQIQHGNYLSIKGSTWVWQELDPETPSLFPFDLVCLDPSSTSTIPLELTLFFAADAEVASLPPLVMRVNNRPVSAPLNLSAGTQTYSVMVDRSALIEIGNVLSLQFATPVKKQQTRVYMDHFRLRYPRLLIARGGQLEIATGSSPSLFRMAGFGKDIPLIFDVTDPEKPFILETMGLGGSVAGFFEDQPNRKIVAITPATISEAPDPQPMIDTGLANRDDEADYLIIYNRMFAETVKPLASLHREQGMKVRVVDVDEILQDYAYGESTPHAIKDFLTDAVRRWRVPPTYVCLVGDASSDYRDELRGGVPNLLPTFTYDDPSGDSWASDHWYAMLNGDDLLPDILLGRISVKNVQDGGEIVRKTVNYTKDPPMGPWRSRFTFASDMNDGALDFRRTAERVRWGDKPRAFGSTQIFLDEFPWEDEFYLPREVVKKNNIKVSTPATLEILRTLDAGSSFLTFFGHGSPNIWTDERIWFGGGTQRSDNLNLRNDGRLPFVAVFSCNQGAFDYPMPPWDINISEDMMRVPNGGAIAMFVPTGPGSTVPHEQLATALMRAMFREDLRRLGETTELGRIYYALAGGAPQMTRMFTLLGDPALDLAIPTETREGRVVPSAIDPVELVQNPYIHFGGWTGRVPHGTFVASLYDPDDIEVYHAVPRAFRFGWLKTKMRMPPSPKLGTWTVRAYYGNKYSRRDGQLFGTFEVARPVLKVASFQWDSLPKKPGETAILSARIVNEHKVAARGVPYEIASEDAQGVRKVLSAGTLDLQGREEKIVRANWTTAPGLYRFDIALKRFVFPQSDQELPEASRSLTASISDNSGPRATVLPSEVRGVWRSDAETRVTVPVHYSGLSTPTSCTVEIAATSGTVPTASTTIVLGSAAVREGVRYAELALGSPKTKASLAYRVVVRLGDSQQPVQSTMIQIARPGRPELEIVPASVRFIPSRPTEGETVFLRTLVRNGGNAISSAFRLEASALGPDGKYEALRSRAQEPTSQPPLAPGRARWITTRWDYDAYQDYAGTRTIRLHLGPSDTPLSKSDLTVPVRILKRPAVEVTGLLKTVRDLPGGEQECQVRIRVRNTGEATASNYLLGYYNRIPVRPEDYVSPRFLHEQVNLAPIEGGKALIFNSKWKRKQDDSNTSPTAKVYRLTKSIRAEVAEREKTPGEW